MSEILRDPGGVGMPDNPESNTEVPFTLIPFDASMFSDAALAISQGSQASRIKESLQKMSRVDPETRLQQTKSTHGDYVWSIVADLGMTETIQPPKSYIKMFAEIQEKASNTREYGIDLVELLDRYEDHPAIRTIDILSRVTSKSGQSGAEVIQLRREMLILLSEQLG